MTTELSETDTWYLRGSHLLSEALELRGFEVPEGHAGPHEVHQALVQVRARLDRLEAIMLAAMGLRDTAQVQARKLEQKADDAWDDEAERARRTGDRYDFEGAQERMAAWRVKVRPQRAAARTAREAADKLAAAEKRISVMYRGLDNTRLDLHRRLAAFNVERALES